MLKTLEHLFKQKWDDFTQKEKKDGEEMKLQIINAFLEICLLKYDTYQPDTIFELADRFVDEFNAEARIHHLLDFVYWIVVRHEMKDDIDTTPILKAIEDKFDPEGMKPRHLFNALGVHTVIQR